jgi:exopolysaccharide biosynthesis polyprenyl glycosylphosphotransferase
MTDVLPGSRPATQVPEEVQPAGASIRRRRFERSLDRLFPTPVRTHSPRDSGRRWALAISDVITLAIAMFVVGAVTGQDSADSVLVLLAALPGWVLLNKLLGLYDRDASLVHKSTLDELPRVAQSVFLGAGTLFIFGPPVLGLPLDRAQIVLFCVIGVVLVAGGRSVARHLVRLRYPAERTVIVGSGEVARLVARKIHAHPEYGVNVVGFVDVSAAANGDGSDLLGDISAFEHLCREFQAERVVIAFSSLSHEHLLDVIRVSRLLNLKISVVPRLFEMIGGSVEIDEVEGLTMLGLRGLGRTRSSLMLKRAIDLAGAGIGLLILAPLLGVIAIAIKLDSRGPVLFAQRRIGRGAEPFRMLKFRTMVRGAHQMKDDLRHLNEAELPMFKIRHDPRITGVGRFLRRMSLDELPQLVNVLRGEMSLVGPRPLIPEEDSQVIGWHRARLDLTPGLTGPWQVLGRTRIPFQEMVKLDYLYVNDWSIWNDVKLLLRTGPVVVRRSGH